MGNEPNDTRSNEEQVNGLRPEVKDALAWVREFAPVEVTIALQAELLRPAPHTGEDKMPTVILDGRGIVVGDRVLLEHDDAIKAIMEGPPAVFANVWTKGVVEPELEAPPGWVVLPGYKFGNDMEAQDTAIQVANIGEICADPEGNGTLVWTTGAHDDDFCRVGSSLAEVLAAVAAAIDQIAPLRVMRLDASDIDFKIREGGLEAATEDDSYLGPLVWRCAKCERTNPTSVQMCAGCGHSLNLPSPDRWRDAQGGPIMLPCPHPECNRSIPAQPQVTELSDNMFCGHCGRPVAWDPNRGWVLR